MNIPNTRIIDETSSLERSKTDKTVRTTAERIANAIKRFWGVSPIYSIKFQSVSVGQNNV